MPATNAPTTSGNPTTYAPTTPGRTAWEMASPIRDHPLSTRKQERIAIGRAMSNVTAKACCIKV